jgi:hypothetical protein
MRLLTRCMGAWYACCTRPTSPRGEAAPGQHACLLGTHGCQH